jgi:misacylated tRNA(Ala) deacylase
MTKRLYWLDDHCHEAVAFIEEIKGNEAAFDQTCFYPGGGGQPSDHGFLILPDFSSVDVTSVRADRDGIVWHTVANGSLLKAGKPVLLKVDIERRAALGRYHTVLHILNTIVKRDYDGWITGTQIEVDYSRIDFNVPGFTPERIAELEKKVNAVIEANHRISSYTMSEAWFATQPGLLRSLEAKPPLIDGHVRVVEIIGFDEQACGGTHPPSTGGLGRFSITKTENKGKQNKRLYVHLAV